MVILTIVNGEVVQTCTNTFIDLRNSLTSVTDDITLFHDN